MAVPCSVQDVVVEGFGLQCKHPALLFRWPGIRIAYMPADSGVWGSASRAASIRRVDREIRSAVFPSVASGQS